MRGEPDAAVLCSGHPLPSTAADSLGMWLRSRNCLGMPPALSRVPCCPDGCQTRGGVPGGATALGVHSGLWKAPSSCTQCSRDPWNLLPGNALEPVHHPHCTGLATLGLPQGCGA